MRVLTRARSGSRRRHKAQAQAASRRLPSPPKIRICSACPRLFAATAPPVPWVEHKAQPRACPRSFAATGVPDRLHHASNLVGWERFFRSAYR